MDTSKMRYPFGRCIACGMEFNSELRNEQNIAHCPWCGTEIDDFLSIVDSSQEEERKDDIYCEECGQRIYERTPDGKGGDWIEGHGNWPGVCFGPCERELCGKCGDWDEDGCCPKCRDKNPFKGKEDERNCQCINCEAKFREGEIKIKDDEEYCPSCGKSGCIADVVDDDGNCKLRIDSCDACPHDSEAACMGCHK